MESMVINKQFWQDKIVLITGNTGFKGAWLSLWLRMLGSKVIGFALEPPSDINLFTLAHIADDISHVHGDIRNFPHLQATLTQHQPDIIFHIAAQSLVQPSYEDPITTYTTNAIGTLNVFETARHCKSVKAIINVTSDKCYENKEWIWGYRENEPLGGKDPYSSSKACAELIATSYRESFFKPLASVRAGNVIGGGDWAKNRLIPDIIRAFTNAETALIRNPHSIRPWQHVLEPLAGYLLLAEKLWGNPLQYNEAWNFGPHDTDTKPVYDIVNLITKLWGNNASWDQDNTALPHEAKILKLDIAKAKSRLGWQPKLTIDEALIYVVDWYQAWLQQKDMKTFTCMQIQQYSEKLR